MENNFTRSDGMSFWEFLEGQKIPYNKEDFPFLTYEDSPRILPVMDFEKVLGMGYAAEVVGYVYRKMGRALSYITSILDSDFKYGFHDHSDKHTLWVAMQTTELLLRSGRSYDGQDDYDARSEVLATLVGMLHDIGNLIDRKEHSKYSVKLLEQLFVNKDRPEWQYLMDAIRYHEEPVIIENNIGLERLFPLQWALVLADKIHCGRDRIGPKSVGIDLTRKPFEHDLYLLVDSMIARSSWHIEADTFVFQLDFSITEFSSRFEKYLHEKDRLWVPDPIYKEFARSGKTYRQSFVDLFSKLYKPRMDIATKAAFLLFPWLESFEVRLSDNDVRDKVGSKTETLVSFPKGVEHGGNNLHAKEQL